MNCISSSSISLQISLFMALSGLCVTSVKPTDTLHGMRWDVIELLRAIKPGCLRYPGGCYAEFYEWQEGLLPVDQRSPIYNTDLDFLFRDTDGTDTHEVGIDEFIALCREIGCEPAITVRLSENTPENAAALVEYCNGDGLILTLVFLIGFQNGQQFIHDPLGDRLIVIPASPDGRNKVCFTDMIAVG